MSFEALVRTWVHDSRFNGDIWYPFICPLTKRTTAPIRDLPAIELLSRIGASLGLPSTPPFFFRHRAAGAASSWTVYPLLDQLVLASKLVLAFHHRSADDQPLLVSIKNNHVVSIRTIKHDDGLLEFRLALSVVTAPGVAERHAIGFHVEEGVQSPFPRCRFVSEEAVARDE